MTGRTSGVLLSRSNRQLWRLAETNIIGIYSADISGRIYEANDYILNLLGYSREELENGELKWTEITPPEFLPMDYAAIEVVKKSGSSPVYEKEYLRKDGSRVPILIGFAEVEPATGEYICFIIDQTERMRVLHEVQDSEERFRATFEQAAFGVAHVAGDGSWLRTNRRFHEILGYGEKDGFPPRVQDLLLPEDVELLLERTKALYESGESPFTLEMQWLRRDASLVWVAVTTSLLRDEAGNAKYHILVIREITARKLLQESLEKALEAAEEGSRAKTDFLANMSHEMRTPLAGVLGMIDLVMEMNIGEEERRLLETASASARVLLRLIEELLDFSRVGAGRMTFEHRQFDVRNCVASAVDVVRRRAEKKKILMNSVVDATVPAGIAGDQVRVKQVLMNLLDNAVKFTERGRIEVTVTWGDDEHLLFCVLDTGIGIPEEKMKRLFRMFSQVDPSSTRKYGGTGLGLALSKQFVEGMGGRIWVETKEGQGSRFCFTLPVEVRCNGTTKSDGISD